jgi:hypothetical protein
LILNNLPKEISVNELPSWSNWPVHLIGVEAFKTVERNLAKIQSEYSEDSGKSVMMPMTLQVARWMQMTSATCTMI